MHDVIAGDILSCVVYAHPGRGAEVAARIGEHPGTEVVAGIAEGKLVVTIEDTPSAKAADVMASLNAIAGVISTLLIYHRAAEASTVPCASTALTAPSERSPALDRAPVVTEIAPASPAHSLTLSEDSQ
ncbi:chaperone NapD [Halochromatium glycolicum]|jgi:nitrate reductase NapAB chaperone NapD|nr:chaperone NapD [Halochromatium glycolicum]